MAVSFAGTPRRRRAAVARAARRRRTGRAALVGRPPSPRHFRTVGGLFVDADSPRHIRNREHVLSARFRILYKAAAPGGRLNAAVGTVCRLGQACRRWKAQRFFSKSTTDASGRSRSLDRRRRQPFGAVVRGAPEALRRAGFLRPSEPVCLGGSRARAVVTENVHSVQRTTPAQRLGPLGRKRPSGDETEV